MRFALYIIKPLVEGKGPDDPVFTTANGKRITKSGLTTAIKTMNNILTRLANGKGPSVDDVKEHLVKPKKIRENATPQEIRRHQKRLELYKEKVERREKEQENQITVNIRMHDFRDDFATALYDSGLMERDIKMAQYLLGHKDIKTTMDIYVHLTEERKKKSASEMVDFLDGWVKQIGPDLSKWCQNDVRQDSEANGADFRE